MVLGGTVLLEVPTNKQDPEHMCLFKKAMPLFMGLGKVARLVIYCTISIHNVSCLFN